MADKATNTSTSKLQAEQEILLLKEKIIHLQERGSFEDLANACTALLLANVRALTPPDEQAKNIVARLMLLASDDVDPGRIANSMRVHTFLLDAVALEIDALLQAESTSNRRILLGLLSLAINQYGLQLKLTGDSCRFVDVSISEECRSPQGSKSGTVEKIPSMSEKDLQKPQKAFKVVSFFTSYNEYADHAKRLEQSLNAYEIPHELRSISESGSWEIICSRKAKFLLECWEDSDSPIVWLDADATVEAYPSLFESIDADFAIHKWKGFEFGSGTLYFAKTENAHLLLKQWVLRCEADPITWDQVHLQSSWCDIASTRNLRTYWLPRSYLQIFDASQEEPAVIKHWQASRVMKADGRVSGQETLSYTQHGQDIRRSSMPWRSAESLFWIDQGVQHIIPDMGTQFPEGFDVEYVLRESLEGQLPVLEVGCGVGRIAQLFSPSEYIGVDVNPYALMAARNGNPHHLFRISDVGLQYPQAPSVLVYTVLLHVSDDEIRRFLAEICLGRRRVVIAELMDRRWRRSGFPPVFNRDPEEYVLLMQELGFTISKFSKHEYARYSEPPFNIGKDSRLTTLVFFRNNGA